MDFPSQAAIIYRAENYNEICIASFQYRINTFICISTDTTSNTHVPDLDGKGAAFLRLWPPDCAAHYQMRNLGLSPYLSVQEMSSIWFLIGTISSQSDITGVMAEVMGTRWWGDGDEPLLSLSSPHHSIHVVFFRPFAYLIWHIVGVYPPVLLTSKCVFIAFSFQYNCHRLNQCAFTSPHTFLLVAMIDPTGSVALFIL